MKVKIEKIVFDFYSEKSQIRRRRFVFGDNQKGLLYYVFPSQKGEWYTVEKNTKKYPGFVLVVLKKDDDEIYFPKREFNRLKKIIRWEARHK